MEYSIVDGLINMDLDLAYEYCFPTLMDTNQLRFRCVGHGLR
jgi:hypothetical protein